MRFDQLRQFVILCELRHFRQAAEKTQISTSALTRSIKTLEEEIGCCLFARSTRSVELTPEGKVFLDFCRNTLTELEKTKSTLNLIQNKGDSKLVIGYSSEASTIVPLSCGQFMATHPEVKIELQQQPATELRNRLQRGEIDISVSTELPEVMSSSVHLPDQLILFVSREHPLAHKGSISQADLKDYALYACFSKSRQIQAMMDEASHSLNKASELRLGSLEEVIKTVANSSSFALASIEHANAVAQQKNLILLHTSEEQARQQLVIRTRQETSNKSHIQSLLNEIKQTAEQLDKSGYLSQI